MMTVDGVEDGVYMFVVGARGGRDGTAVDSSDGIEAS